MLFTLVDALELEATSAERGVLDALEFIRAMRHRRGKWIEQTCLVTRDGEQARISADVDAFASDMWKRTLRDRLPERSLLDILARSAHLTGWHRHFGPASGSDPKIRDTLGRYVVTAFAYGGNLGPTEVARHMRGISAHEIYTAGNKHADAGKIHKASADVINAFAKLDVARMWGDGQAAATDGSQIDTWENNLLAETSIR